MASLTREHEVVERGTLISECTALRSRLSLNYVQPRRERIRVVRATHCVCEQPINGEKKLPAELPSVFSFSSHVSSRTGAVSACAANLSSQKLWQDGVTAALSPARRKAAARRPAILCADLDCTLALV